MPRALAILLTLLFSFSDLSAQTHGLRSLNGPDGGSISEIEISPAGEFFIRTSRSIYHHGSFEKRFVEIVGSDVIASIAIDSSGRAFGGRYGGLILPFVNGKFALQDTLRAFYATSFEITILRSEIIAAFERRALALYSGGTWLRDTLPANIQSVASKNDTLVALAGGSLYHIQMDSVGIGEWQQIDQGSSLKLTSLELTSIGLIAGTASSGVWIADNIGAEWRSISENLPDWQIKDIMYADGYIVSAHGNNLYATSDLGATWIEGRDRIRTMPVNVVAARNGVWYAGTGREGLFSSTDKGQSWPALNVGIAESRVTAIQEYQGRIWTGSSFNAVHAYDPATETWTDRNKGLRAGSTISKFIVRADMLYALEDRAGLYKWVADSSAWTKVPLTHSISSFYSDMELIDDRTLVVISESVQIVDLVTGIFTFKQFGQFQLRDVDYANGKIYIASENGLFVSSDRGANWDTIYPSASRVIAFNDELIIETTGDKMYRSMDDGNTWSLLDQRVNGLLELDGTVYGFKSGLIRSTDRGISWETMVDDVPFESIFKTSSGQLLIGAGYTGVLELLPMSAVERTAAAFESTIQITPNPLKSLAIISFDLLNESQVDLDIFNFASQHVASLISGKRSLPGAQQIQWDATKLPSGVYSVRLRCDGQITTQQVIVRR
jgi:hypothetical protein